MNFDQRKKKQLWQQVFFNIPTKVGMLFFIFRSYIEFQSHRMNRLFF